jgi:hypothetical protein
VRQISRRKLSPTVKGQLTKASKAFNTRRDLLGAARCIFGRSMPREQAKHAAKRFVAEVQP